MSFTAGIVKLDDAPMLFKVVAGLTEETASISFQSIAWPEYYLRHSGYVMYQQKISRWDDQGKADATFYARENLLIDGFVSFQSTNYPDYFIMYDGTRMIIKQPTTDNLDAFAFSRECVVGVYASAYMLAILTLPGLSFFYRHLGLRGGHICPISVRLSITFFFKLFL